MEKEKKYWCFTCNSECKINIIKQEDDEEYQCSKCKNTFIEEISPEDNPSNFHIEQPSQSNQNIPQQINNININNNNNIDGINITITNFNPLENFNLSNFNNFNIDNINSQNNENLENQPEPNYEYGMNDTFLFLPSTVHYRRIQNRNLDRNNLMSNFLSGGEIITEVVNPNGQNIIISRNIVNSNGLNNFLLNHINDHQFENFINIITALDLQHKGNPPASDRAINNLKKIEINENNLNEFSEQSCNVCLENFNKGQITMQLDCGHYFHEKCIIHWLKMRNTCPVCRHELESNDPKYEKRKHLHRETIRNFHNNSGNNNNNSENNNNNQPGSTA